MRTIPIDSTDAREQRELEEELERDQERAARGRAGASTSSLADAPRTHDPRCRRGWLGEDEDGRPIPCLTCRPHLAEVACRVCQVPPRRCADQVAGRRGRCCEGCDHDSPSATCDRAVRPSPDPVHGRRWS